ncbi:MAG: hypothetical protein AAF664_21195 [Planctomycetota bacterium]
MNDAPSKPSSRLTTLFWVISIFAVLLALYFTWDRAIDRLFQDLLIGSSGSIESVDDWPRPLTKLADETSLVSADDLQVHCLCQGFDPEYVWRMPCDGESFAEIKSRWQLSVISKPDTHIYGGFSHNSGIPTPDWWNPADLTNVAYFACPGALAGRKSDQFQVAYHADSSTLFVHYWFNF